MNKEMKEKLLEVVNAASCVVLSRDGDVSTEDGEFATCATGDIIYLEEALVNLLDLPYDEVTLEVLDHLKMFEDKL